ncbi:hypothetical protein, partial [Acidiphilium sp.]|uniref:hypothetical protein n=1 Tax=Acidiphilium sp. TaxID=527 RepID=UPI002584D86A
VAVETPVPQGQKVFCFFFTKKKPSRPHPSETIAPNRYPATICEQKLSGNFTHWEKRFAVFSISRYNNSIFFIGMKHALI